MPKLVRLYIVQVAIGFALAAVFTAALIALDVAHLRHLVMNAPGGWLAAALLVIFNGIVFAGVQFGIAVMRMADRDGGGPGRRRPEPLAPAALAVPVPAHPPRPPVG